MTDLFKSPADAAKDALELAASRSVTASSIVREIGRLEADRHERKDHAIRRLMTPPAEGEKGLSRTAAEAIVNSDPQYNEYLKHLADRQGALESARDEVRTAHLTARLAIALVEQAVAA